MTIEVAYEARQEVDQTEGRRGSVLLGVFWQKEAAQRMADGHGVMGTMGPVIEIYVVRADDSKWYRISDTDPVPIRSDINVALRESALAKLTAAEKKALGL